MSTRPVIESPCRKVCVLDVTRDSCEGCGRTRAEIAGWVGMTPEARREIMKQLPARLAGTVSARL